MTEVRYFAPTGVQVATSSFLATIDLSGQEGKVGVGQRQDRRVDAGLADHVLELRTGLRDGRARRAHLGRRPGQGRPRPGPGRLDRRPDDRRPGDRDRHRCRSRSSRRSTRPGRRHHPVDRDRRRRGGPAGRDRQARQRRQPGRRLATDRARRHPGLLGPPEPDPACQSDHHRHAPPPGSRSNRSPSSRSSCSSPATRISSPS